jgi:predicted DNA-binding transcriptional regulator AlpA
MDSDTKPNRLLPLAEVERRVNRRKSWIYAAMAQKPPGFPLCVQLPGSRSVAWREADIDRWIADLPAVGPRTEPSHLAADRADR